jgi:hypothetical protein
MFIRAEIVHCCVFMGCSIWNESASFWKGDEDYDVPNEGGSGPEEFSDASGDMASDGRESDEAGE